MLIYYFIYFLIYLFNNNNNNNHIIIIIIISSSSRTSVVKIQKEKLYTRVRARHLTQTHNKTKRKQIKLGITFSIKF